MWFHLPWFPKHPRIKPPRRKPKNLPVVDIFKHDRYAALVPGSPGYRVARGRSGLGYLETQAELARMQGSFVQWLFAGKFRRTKDPIVLFGMFLTGLCLAVIPVLLVLGGVLQPWDDQLSFVFVLLLLGVPEWALGFYCLISLVVSILEWGRGT